mmetsp:Transcript_33902/g.74659  ORF Transcript_33902/g.74659 Transcript_33902/m.74659 type:complete len:246 (-) Transcript_33902:139-876(-)
MMFLANGGGGKSSGGGGGGSGSKGGGGGFFGFGKKQDPYDLAKEWKREIQKQVRVMDRDILNIKRSEQRSVNECKALAKKNRMGAVRILAKEIASTRKTVERMYTAKAQLNSVASTLQTSMSMMKLQGCMEKSAEIMTAMNKLVNIKEISLTMGKMAREMEKAGLVEEIIGDTMESMEPEGLDADADEEVNRVVAEITGGVLSGAGAAPQESLKAPAAEPAAQVEQPSEQEDVSTNDLMSRLQAL